jgi:hypothetical protein
VYYTPQVASEPADSPTLEEQLRASIDMVQRRKAQTVGELGDGTLAIMAPPADVKMSSTSLHPRPAAAERLAPAVAEFSSRLVMETTALVDCYASVLETANKKHGTLIKSDDIRSLLLSCYINASKGQGGRNAA